MKNYLDITLLPDAEVNLGFIWQKVYQQIHLALVGGKTENGGSAIAVSFPDYGKGRFHLGNRMRLLSPEEVLLQQLDIAKWLNRLRDYAHLTSIRKVPPTIDKYARFSRRQFNTNVDRFARRRAKRKGETQEQALQYYSEFKGKTSKLPFVNMISLSSSDKVGCSEKNRFRLFIEMEKNLPPEQGEFSCYGLSATSTIPWF